MKKAYFIIFLIIIILLVGFGSFYFLKKQAPKIDEVTLVLEGARTAAGLNFNLAPEKVKWNTETGEIILSGQGGFYLDALDAPKVSQIFDSIDKYLRDKGFNGDSNNSEIIDESNVLRKSIKDEIICNLSKRNNPNDTSTVGIACADLNNPIFSFSSGMGNDCQADSDCGVITDGCKHERVCRNLKYEFFNDCDNPSQLVNDIDFSVARCQCESNKCIPKKPGSSSPGGTSEPIIKLK